MIPFRSGSRYSWFLLVLLFIRKHGICARSASAYARNMASSSIISISSGSTASLRPPVQVRLLTFIWMLSCIMSSNTPLTRTPNTPIYGFLSFPDSVNDLMKRSLSNCCPEYASYASFKRRIAPANLTFSHSLSSCGRSSMYKNLHLPVLATMSYTRRMESQQLTSTN